MFVVESVYKSLTIQRCRFISDNHRNSLPHFYKSKLSKCVLSLSISNYFHNKTAHSLFYFLCKIHNQDADLPVYKKSHENCGQQTQKTADYTTRK